MVQVIAIGAVGALVWVGYRAFQREMQKLKEKAAPVDPPEPSGELECDPETGVYRPKK